ncbi:MAG: hypothetical protein WC738_04250 [Candidatus Omnitrophota bacterium]
MSGCDYMKKSFKVPMTAIEPKNRRLGRDSKVMTFDCDSCKNHGKEICDSCTGKRYYERVEDETA